MFGDPIFSLVNTVLSAITSWVAAGASELLTELGHVLSSTTSVPLGDGFLVEYRVLERFGLELVALFLLLAIIQAVVNADPAQLLRTALIKLPAALLLSGIAIEVVSLLLSATDAMSAQVFDAAGNAGTAFLQSFAIALTVDAIGHVDSAGFAGLFLAGVAVVVAFILWMELVIRSAAISVATLFLPLALAGVVWPVTAHWARKFAETIAGLIASKLVISAVLAFAVISLGDANGLSGIIEGIALIALSAMAPFSLLRLIPFVEAGAGMHLEGLARRGIRAGRGAVEGYAGIDAMESNGPVSPFDDIPFAEGEPDPEGPEFDALVAEFSSRLADRSGTAQSGPPDASDAGSSDGDERELGGMDG